MSLGSSLGGQVVAVVALLTVHAILKGRIKANA
jgi:hypothetical protein